MSRALMLSVPPLLWVGNAVVGRLPVGAVPPLALNALRWWLALALLLAYRYWGLGVAAVGPAVAAFFCQPHAGVCGDPVGRRAR